jgi:hypothetical protein
MRVGGIVEDMCYDDVHYCRTYYKAVCVGCGGTVEPQAFDALVLYSYLVTNMLGKMR